MLLSAHLDCSLLIARDTHTRIHKHIDNCMTTNDQTFVLIKSLLLYLCPCLHMYVHTNLFELTYIHQYICAKKGIL